MGTKTPLTTVLFFSVSHPDIVTGVVVPAIVLPTEMSYKEKKTGYCKNDRISVESKDNKPEELLLRTGVSFR